MQKNFPIDRGAYWMTTSGDTTIGGLPATRIVIGQVAACSGMAFPFPFSTIQHTYLHQDSLGRVYSLRPGGQMTKLYDLGLQVGDTMQTRDYFGSPIDYHVDSVGLLQFADNIPRKALYVTLRTYNATALFSPVIWVEGIGDIYNGPVTVPGIESYTDAACYKEAELLLVTNPYTSLHCVLDCERLVSAETPLPASTTVSPSPAHDQLRLTHTDAQPMQVRLLALDGRVLHAWSLAGAQTHELALGDLVAGLYVLEVRDAEGRMAVRRVMVE